MKKFLMFLCAVMLVLGMVGTASAIPFSDTQTLGVTLGEGPLADILLPNSYTYYHATPSDFEVPWDTVNSATLEISGYWIDGNDDTLEVQGTAVGVLSTGGSYDIGWSWSQFDWVVSNEAPSISNFDISSTFSSWSTGAPLSVTITANGSFGDGILELASSTFNMDYDNGAAPVPEPATMLLMGTGLLGLAARRRFAKKG